MKQKVWFITEVFQDPEIAEFFDIAGNCQHVTEVISLDRRVKPRTRDVTELYNLPFSE